MSSASVLSVDERSRLARSIWSVKADVEAVLAAGGPPKQEEEIWQLFQDELGPSSGDPVVAANQDYLKACFVRVCQLGFQAFLDSPRKVMMGRIDMEGVSGWEGVSSRTCRYLNPRPFRLYLFTTSLVSGNPHYSENACFDINAGVTNNTWAGHAGGRHAQFPFLSCYAVHSIN
jgi:hypothetical protein